MFLSFGAAQAQPIVIGTPAWPSAQVTAHIIENVLSQTYGAETELRDQGTMTLLSGIGNETVHIHPEIWLPNLQSSVDRLSGADGALVLNPNPVPATQNICTTSNTISQTGISSLSDLAKPEFASSFDTDGDGRGEIWIGAPTWSSTEIERIRAKSYGYAETMALLEMPEDVAMAAVDAAAALSEPIVFYCYGPHHVFKLHDIVRLEEPAHDPSRWTIVKRADSSGWLEQSQADTAWGESKFHVGYAASLSSDAPKIAAFLDAIKFEPEDITGMSYAVQVEGKPAAEVAKQWIEANADRVAEWTK